MIELNLRPCGCGGTAHIEAEGKENKDIEPTDDDRIYVVCDTCFTRTPPKGASIHYTATEIVAKIWNKAMGGDDG